MFWFQSAQTYASDGRVSMSSVSILGVFCELFGFTFLSLLMVFISDNVVARMPRLAALYQISVTKELFQ